MNKNLHPWTRFTPLLFTFFLAATFVAAAADTPDRNAGRQRGGFRGGINLDDKQIELYREAVRKNGDQLNKLDDQLRAAQKALMQAVLAENYDEKTVKEKAEAVARIEVEITALRAKAFSAVAPTLTPEQREQLENSRFGIMMLSGGFGGPDARGRGRQPSDQPRRRQGQ